MMLEAQFEHLVSKAVGTQGVLDHYGATDRAEFFAVATEAFFERPTELQPRAPGALRSPASVLRTGPGGCDRVREAQVQALLLAGDSTMYLAMKTLHVLAAVLFLGNIITGLFWKAHGDRTGDPRIIAHTLDGIIRSDRWFTIPSVLLILVSGFGAAGWRTCPSCVRRG